MTQWSHAVAICGSGLDSGLHVRGVQRCSRELRRVVRIPRPAAPRICSSVGFRLGVVEAAIDPPILDCGYVERPPVQPFACGRHEVSNRRSRRVQSIRGHAQDVR